MMGLTDDMYIHDKNSRVIKVFWGFSKFLWGLVLGVNFGGKEKRVSCVLRNSANSFFAKH